MSDQEILEKALGKAIANGYSGLLPVTPDSPGHRWHPYGLIFNHLFAKALWGDAGLPGFTMLAKELGAPKYWQWHLQQMVIAEDPIKYLGEHI